MKSQDAQWWIKSSDGDYDAFLTLREKGNLNNAAFHLQQCAEKRLKAVCVAKGRFSHTHSIIDILKKLGEMGVTVKEDHLKAARRIDPHYIMARYPNGVGGAPQDFYDLDLIEDLEKCAKILMSLADSNL